MTITRYALDKDISLKYVFRCLLYPWSLGKESHRPSLTSGTGVPGTCTQVAGSRCTFYRISKGGALMLVGCLLSSDRLHCLGPV